MAPPPKTWVIRKLGPGGITLLAATLTGVETVVHVIGLNWLPVPAWGRAALIFGIVGAAFIARREVEGRDDE